MRDGGRAGADDVVYVSLTVSRRFRPTISQRVRRSFVADAKSLQSHRISDRLTTDRSWLRAFGVLDTVR